MPDGVDPIQAQLDRLGRWLPLPLLAVSVLLAWLIVQAGWGSDERFSAALIVAAAAAAWTFATTMRAAGRSARFVAVAFAGHTGLAAVLVGLNPWFGLFAWTGYMLADELPRRWPWAGFVVSAMILAASQVGGYPHVELGSLAGWLLVTAVNAAVVFVFRGVTNRVLEQNTERGRMITELNETNERLSAALTENAGLHAQLVEQAREAGVQDERQRLAGEIHDTLAQGLTGIVTQLEAADQARHLPAEWQRHLDQARDLARSSLTEARRSVRALRPEQLEHATLADALGELLHAWSQASGVAAHAEVTGTVRALPDDSEAALFRVAQEALTNVGKHAHAGKVRLTLTYLDDVLLLDVRDDGLGWSGAARPGSYGLDSMRARLARAGGTLEIETAPGEGTALSAAVPMGPA